MIKKAQKIICDICGEEKETGWVIDISIHNRDELMHVLGNWIIFRKYGHLIESHYCSSDCVKEHLDNPDKYNKI